MSEHNTEIVDTSIELFGLKALRKSIELEAKGIKFKGPSKLSIAKKIYGFKGNRETVLKLLSELINEKGETKWN